MSKADDKTITSRRRARKAKRNPPNIAADPIGTTLILPSSPVENGGPSVAVLLRAIGAPMALTAVPKGDGTWSLSEPKAVSSENTREALRAIACLRKDAEQEVEKLIGLLDRLGPDPDLEENGDDDSDEQSENEPSLGSVNNFVDQNRWSADGNVNTHNVDCEGDEHDGAEPSEDGEPSLGSFDRMLDQTKSWRQHDGPGIWSAGTDAEQDRLEASLIVCRAPLLRAMPLGAGASGATIDGMVLLAAAMPPREKMP